jgi:hypothetical protein
MSTPTRVVNDLGAGKEQAVLARMVEDMLSIVPKEDLAGLDRVVLQNAEQVAQAVASSPEGSCEPAECFKWRGYYQQEWSCFPAYIALNIDNIQFNQHAVTRSLGQKLWRRLNRRFCLAMQLYHPLYGAITQHIESTNPTREFPDDVSRQVYILPMLAQLLNLQTWKDARRNMRNYPASLNEKQSVD